MASESQILSCIVDILRTKVNFFDGEELYSSPDVALRMPNFGSQIMFSYDTSTEQWVILLKINGNYFVIGGYKKYRLFELNCFESFIDLETGRAVTNDTLASIYEELLVFYNQPEFVRMI